MTKFCIMFVVFVLSGVMPAFALDLVQIYELGLQNDPQLKASRAARDSTLETRPQALAQLLPTISAGANHFRTHENIKDVESSIGGFDGEDSFNRHWLSLNFSQPIYRYDYWVQLQQSNNLVTQAEAEYAAEEQGLIIRIALAYFNVLAAQDALVFAREEKKAIQRQLDQAQQLFEAWFIGITDVHEAQAAFDNSTANVILAESEVDDAWEALHEITGDTEKTLAQLTSDFPLNPPEPQAIDQWSETATQQNPILVALRSATEIKRQNIKFQESGHYPTLELVADHALNRTSANGRSDFNVSDIGLQLNVPIYSGGGVTSRTRQALYNFEQSQENLDKQLRAVNRQARDAYRGVVSRISRVKALKSATISGESALDTTQAGFEVGTRTMVDVLAEQRNLYRTRLEYSRVRYEYILDGLRLKQAAGSLSREDLESVNIWLK